jgi:uncharacterized protein (UPF0261 family)
LADLIAAGDKGRAMQTMMDGARAIVTRLYAEGQLDGVLAVGGGQGTAIGTAAMQALPIGVPKLNLLRGQLWHVIGDEAVLMQAGDTTIVPAGVPHVAFSVGDEDAEMIVAYPTGQRQFRTEV